jgi:serine/threonine-protein kinase
VVGSSVLDAVDPVSISHTGFRQILGSALGRVADDRSWPATAGAAEQTLADGPDPTWVPPDGGTVGGLEETIVDGPLPAPSGRYRVLRPLAQGGLGQVFVAYDEELQRQVALKEVQARFADEAASRARFVREARITARLEHPGIVPVYGLGRHSDRRPYYAMRLIGGVTLREEIDRYHADAPGRDPGERALELRRLLGRFLDVCNTMAYAHSRGVMHRDLKPSNIQLGPYGETLVVDWGLAKPFGPPGGVSVGDDSAPLPVADGPEHTLCGVVVGTPAYMSPEQAEGHIDRLGPASDIYNLGAVLYTLLTGKTPFDGTRDVRETLSAARSGRFAPPRAVRPGVPRGLEAVCLKAMALRPDDRYPSARALADDVERWLADERVSAYPEPLPARLARWGRRHRPIAVGAAVSVLITLAGALSLRTNLEAKHASYHTLEVANQILRSTNQELFEELARSSASLATANEELGRRDVAAAHCRRALRLLEALARQHPKAAEYRNRLAATRERLKALERPAVEGLAGPGPRPE